MRMANRLLYMAIICELRAMGQDDDITVEYEDIDEMDDFEYEFDDDFEFDDADEE